MNTELGFVFIVMRDSSIRIPTSAAILRVADDVFLNAEHGALAETAGVSVRPTRYKDPRGLV